MSEIPITNATVDFVAPRQDGAREVEVRATEVDVLISPNSTASVIPGTIRYTYAIYWGDDAELPDGSMPQNGDFVHWGERYPDQEKIPLNNIKALQGAFDEVYWQADIMPIEGT